MLTGSPAALQRQSIDDVGGRQGFEGLVPLLCQTCRQLRPCGGEVGFGLAALAALLCEGLAVELGDHGFFLGSDGLRRRNRTRVVGIEQLRLGPFCDSAGAGFCGEGLMRRGGLGGWPTDWACINWSARSVHRSRSRSSSNWTAIAANRRLGHLALRFGGLLLRQRLRGLRHLRVRGLCLLCDQRNGVEFDAIGLRAAFPFGLNARASAARPVA